MPVKDLRQRAQQSPCPHQGFSLVEALISLTLISTLAALTIPMMTSNTERHRLIDTVIGASGEVTAAYARYLRSNVASNQTSVNDLLQNMNTVRTITDGTTTLQTEDAGNSTLTCTVATPCTVLHSGAYLYYNANERFDGATTANQTYRRAMWFALDPDGPDIQTATVLVLYQTGRITTLQQSNPQGADPAPVFGTVPPVALGTADPLYLAPWLTGTFN